MTDDELKRRLREVEDQMAPIVEALKDTFARTAAGAPTGVCVAAAFSFAEQAYQLILRVVLEKGGEEAEAHVQELTKYRIFHAGMLDKAEEFARKEVAENGTEAPIHGTTHHQDTRDPKGRGHTVH